MSLASRLRFWRRNETEPEPQLERSVREEIIYILRVEFPALTIDDGGHYNYSPPPLPRGTLSRIAREVGCSRAYAGQVAKAAGYTSR